MLPQANSRVAEDHPIWPEPAAPPPRVVAAAAGSGGKQRDVAFLLGQERDVAFPLLAQLRPAQLACWQLALTLLGLSPGWPWPLAAPAVTAAAILLALTAVRWRGQWLYQWARCCARFASRTRRRHLPREDGPRALLHLLAPDAALASIRLDDGDAAVVSRDAGATAVLRPLPSDADPTKLLTMPQMLLPDNDEPPDWGVQLVLHGVAGNRRHPTAWLAVQAFRSPQLSEEDDLVRALDAAVRHVLGELAARDVPVAGLDRAAILGTFASLAHAGGARGEVRERWRHWSCGPIVQAGFRVRGWPTVPDAASRALLRRLLTADTGAVVTVTVSASPVETATLRLAAPTVERLELSARWLGKVAAQHGIRLDRMDGQHAEAVAAALPLGVLPG